MDQRPGSTLRMLAAAAALGLGGCDEEPCRCTLEFRTAAIVVVNAAGTPVPGLTPTVTLVRTGELITLQDQPVGGRYPVISDAQLPLIQSSGEMVRFAVTGSDGSGFADIQFSTTQCRCHIHKVAGPDTLVLR